MSIRFNVSLFVGLFWATPSLLAGPSGLFAEPSGNVPDLSGFFDVATISPMQRTESLGDQQSITPEEARDMEAARAARTEAASLKSDPDREAPKIGASVGGYNAFWLDAGENRFLVDGEYRTSIITTPANGRRPALTSAWGKQDAHALVEDFIPRPGNARWPVEVRP